MIEDLKLTLSKLNKNDLLIRSGTSFNWETAIPNEDLELSCYCAVHCIVNGPVGVNKVTNWPGKDAVFSVKQIIPSITNSQWKYFCSIVERLLVTDDDPIVKMGYTFTRFHATWPTCESVFVPKYHMNHM